MGEREDLRQQYEERQAIKLEELMKIAKRQQQGEFFEFVDEVTDRVVDKEVGEIENDSRGDELDD